MTNRGAGKGDADRVKDHAAYRRNYERIRWGPAKKVKQTKRPTKPR
jgi:hypothetical protein